MKGNHIEISGAKRRDARSLELRGLHQATTYQQVVRELVPSKHSHVSDDVIALDPVLVAQVQHLSDADELPVLLQLDDVVFESV